jgi:hypothetical protein
MQKIRETAVRRMIDKVSTEDHKINLHIIDLIYCPVQNECVMCITTHAQLRITDLHKGKRYIAPVTGNK